MEEGGGGGGSVGWFIHPLGSIDFPDPPPRTPPQQVQDQHHEPPNLAPHPSPLPCPLQVRGHHCWAAPVGQVRGHSLRVHGADKEGGSMSHNARVGVCHTMRQHDSQAA